MLQAILYLLKSISINHYRTSNFFLKIEKIFSNIKNEILLYFTNSEIFNIFKSNKRILLLLIELNILIIDKDIAFIISNEKYRLRNYWA